MVVMKTYNNISWQEKEIFQISVFNHSSYHTSDVSVWIIVLQYQN